MDAAHGALPEEAETAVQVHLAVVADRPAARHVGRAARAAAARCLAACAAPCRRFSWCCARGAEGTSTIAAAGARVRRSPARVFLSRRRRVAASRAARRPSCLCHLIAGARAPRVPARRRAPGSRSRAGGLPVRRTSRAASKGEELAAQRRRRRCERRRHRTRCHAGAERRALQPAARRRRRRGTRPQTRRRCAPGPRAPHPFSRARVRGGRDRTHAIGRPFAAHGGARAHI